MLCLLASVVLRLPAEPTDAERLLLAHARAKAVWGEAQGIILTSTKGTRWTVRHADNSDRLDGIA